LHEDFGYHRDSDSIFKSWEGFTILCPDLPLGEGFTIKGDLGSMQSKRMLFQVNMCDNDTREAEGLEPCYSHEVIEEYISDLQVDAWAQFEKINYSDYEGKPIYRVQDIIASYLME